MVHPVVVLLRQPCRFPGPRQIALMPPQLAHRKDFGAKVDCSDVSRRECAPDETASALAVS
jgi:hypothetical protein